MLIAGRKRVSSNHMPRWGLLLRRAPWPTCVLLVTVQLALRPPPPTTTKGAHAVGWAVHGRWSSLMSASMARRNASARPTAPDLRISAKVRLVSIVAA